MLNGYTVPFPLRICNATGSGTVSFSAIIPKRMPRMKKIKVKLISYLHYELSCNSIGGGKRKAITSNLDLIHRLNSKLDEVREEAVKEALELIGAG